MGNLKKQLFLAISNADVETVTELLSGGLDPNLVNNKTERVTPLMAAVKYNQVPIIQLLLNFGADAGMKDFMGRDVFDYADKFGSCQTFFALLKYANLEDECHAG